MFRVPFHDTARVAATNPRHRAATRAAGHRADQIQAQVRPITPYGPVPDRRARTLHPLHTLKLWAEKTELGGYLLLTALVLLVFLAGGSLSVWLTHL